jgi:NADPH:quinone reductase-like Zn-dependent oxidoreductase
MRAVVADGAGGPEVLSVKEVADPVPGPGELLIDAVAAGVNRSDLLQRRGGYPPPAGASPLIGLECSGRVAALGDGVEGFAVGDEVCALLAGGGYAERVVVPAGQVMPRPDGVSLVDAAALPEAVCTVWSNVFMFAGLLPDETLLVHGGASGIGTIAIQLGKALDCRVIATVGTDEKAARCRELGADVVVNYRTEDFVEVVRRVTAEQSAAGTDGGTSGAAGGTSGSRTSGADVILDIIGASYLSRNLQALATEGRLVVIGMMGGTRAELDLGMLASKRAAVLATLLRPRPVAGKAAIVASVIENVWPLVADGHVRPIVDRRLPLADVAEAHRVVEASEHVGKVLLTV